MKIPAKGSIVDIYPGAHFIERNHSKEGTEFFLEALTEPQLEHVMLGDTPSITYRWKAKVVNLGEYWQDRTKIGTVIGYASTDTSPILGPFLFRTKEEGIVSWTSGTPYGDEQDLYLASSYIWDNFGQYLKIKGVLSLEKGMANEGICDPYYMDVFSKPLSPIKTLKIHFDRRIVNATELIRPFLKSLGKKIAAFDENKGFFERCGIYYTDTSLLYYIGEALREEINDWKCDDLFVERLPLQNYVNVNRPFYLIPDDSIKPVSVCNGCRDYMLSDLIRGSMYGLVSVSIVAEDTFLMPFNPLRNFLLRIKLSIPIADDDFFRPMSSDPEPDIHKFNLSPVRLCSSFKKGWKLCETQFDDVLLRYIYEGDELVNILWVSLFHKGEEVFSLLK